MKRLLPLLTALLLCGPVSAQISTADFEALRALYAATGGADWTNNTGWDFKNATADDVKPYNAQEGTGWFGINEIRKGRVSKLELPANGLTGELPEAIYALDGMRTLNLSGNGLTGTVPAALESLPRLKYLRLEKNAFTGAVPRK